MSLRTYAYRGAKFTVEWAREQSGALPAKQYFETELATKEQARILELFRRLGEAGRIRNRQHFRKLGKKAKGEGRDLWEFKDFQLRFLGAFRPNWIFLVAIGLRKKSDNLRKEDVERAVRILSEHDKRTQADGRQPS